MSVVELEDGVRMIRANNPSPFTGPGTNSYLVGQGSVALIDPGPALTEHIDAILAALQPGERISHILVTHSHLDHSEGVPLLVERTGAPVLAFGDSAAGRSPHMEAFGDLGGGEGVDAAFQPDQVLSDGDVVQGEDWEIAAHWTPGHFGNHLSFEWNGTLFSGDLVMGWSTSLVSPPDGDLTAFMSSLEKLQDHNHRRYFPGHGDPVEAPAARLDELWTHRKMRETQILNVLDRGAASAAGLTKEIYADIPIHLHGAAERNVLAHLIDLAQKNEIAPDGTLHRAAVFSRV